MEQLVYEITIDEVDESVNFVALTDDPAIQRSFMAFNKAKTSQAFSSDTSQRTIFGPLILADTPIPRVHKGREYYVTFPKPTIRKIVEKFFKANNQHNVNAYHKVPIDGLYMYESMITDFGRGVMNPNGYEDVPEGSWYGGYKVENDEVWDEFIKTGIFTGFSVEGFFGLERKEDLEAQYFDLPSPGNSEALGDFMSRCMGDQKMNSEFPDSDQRYAVCVSQSQKYDAQFQQVTGDLLQEIGLFLQTFDQKRI